MATPTNPVISSVPRFLFLFYAVAITACSHSSLPASSGAAALLMPEQTGAGKITHIVYIVQENRSFDNLFQGYPGADTVSRGKDSNGKTLKLQPVSLASRYDIDHSASAMFLACDGCDDLPVAASLAAAY